MAMEEYKTPWTVISEYGVIICSCSQCFFHIHCSFLVKSIVKSLQQQLSSAGLLVRAGESRSRRRFNCSYKPGKIPASRQNRCTQPRCRVPTGSIRHQPRQSLLCHRLVQKYTLNRMCNRTFI